MDGTKNRDSGEPIYNSHEKGKSFFGFAFVICIRKPPVRLGVQESLKL
jgi:hypothetical protein